MASIRKPPPPPPPPPVAKRVVAPAQKISEAVSAQVHAPVEKPQAAGAAAQGAAGVQEQFRKAMETGLDQSRASYEKMKSAAETVTGSLESSYEAASKGLAAFNAKAIDALKAQSDATLDHVKAVMGAKTIGEAIALQSAHVRKQFDFFSAQSKEMAAMAQQLATEAGEPLKTTMKKGFAA